MLLLSLPALFFIAGLVIGRWWIIAAAIATWLGLAIYLKVNNGWKGYGWNDYGLEITVAWAFITIFGAALGVGLRYAASGKARARASA